LSHFSNWKKKTQQTNSFFCELFRNTTSIFIGNLSYKITEKELFDMMDRVGRVKRVVIGQDPRTGRSRGYGFVEFETRKDAEYAYDK
jgi:RNA recognition motif-containing protein